MMARRRLVSPGTLHPGGENRPSVRGSLFPDMQKMSGETKSTALSDIEANTKIAEARSLSGDWDGARGRVFVGLYAVCHRVVYGVAPLELEQKPEFQAASRAALSCLHGHFDDDSDALATFVRWAWKREEGRAKYAREQRWDGRKRLGWRLLFSAHTVTDYLAERRGR